VTRARRIPRAGLELLAIAVWIFFAQSNWAAQKREIRVAAAADLQFVMAELVDKFESNSYTTVSVSYGSSGNFFAQIQNGAPFDVFLSADIEYPRKLEAAGSAEAGTLYEYAVGRIVIWMPPETNSDVRKQGWNSLLDPTVHTIAIAHPDHAPYGRAAVAALQKAGIYEQVKSKLVFGENISQAAQFAQSGNAQAGILAESLTLSSEMKKGQMWEIPSDMHPPIEQAAIVLKSAKNKQAAQQFLDFLKSDSARQIMEKYGFVVPRANSKTPTKP
jgi:molybdate transport system substrate-binding protein